MKNSLFKITLMLALMATMTFIVTGCDEDEDIVKPIILPTTITDFDTSFGWTSQIDEDCQDVFDIEFTNGSVVNFSATEVTGGSVLQIALYAPGVALGGVNLLTGDAAELRCGYVVDCNNNTAGQTVTGFTIPADGIYRLAITRHFGDSCGTEGTYRLQVTSVTAFGEPDQTVEDTASLASEWKCPGGTITEYDQVYGWVSAVGENAQDVFDINFANGAVVDFAATEVTGGSVLQMALYAPGVALGGTNLFMGTDEEYRCDYVAGCNNNTTGQTINGFTIAAAGTYRLAITRNYDQSCGTEGTYNLQITADMGFAEPEQTVDDVPSLATSWGCPGAMVLEHDQVYGWTSVNAQNTQDVFDFNFAAGTVVDFSATEVTGESVLQMALYGPGVALGGINIFTDTEDEFLCGYVPGCDNNTAGQSYMGYLVPAEGTYRLAITRNYGSSCGSVGTYRLQVATDVLFAEPVMSVDDEVSLAAGTGCPDELFTEYDEVLGWSCDTDVNCQDVFDIEFAAGTTVTLAATNVTGDSLLQMALYAPGESLGGINLLTTNNSELRCNFTSGCLNNASGQTVTDFTIVDGGTYRLAITRDWGNSCGSSGTYRLNITTDQAMGTFIQSVEDVASLATSWDCPGEIIQAYDGDFGWSSAIGQDAQDVFDIDFSAGDLVDFAATNVTGNSVLQMALYAPGVALGGTNLFTGNDAELLCDYVVGCSSNTAGQTFGDFTIPSTGTYRLAITRNYGSSCGSEGTYHLRISSGMGFSIPNQTADDVTSLANGAECPPEPALSYNQVFGWSANVGENAQDVFDIDFTAGAVVDFSATEVTGDSVLQMALYGPDVALGGLNLFTGTDSEYLCEYVVGCSGNTAGQSITSVTIPTTGTYRFAITRNWGSSCGSDGTYRMRISSDVEFYEPSQTVDDVVSLATSWNCDLAWVLEYDEVFAWACATGENCQDVFDIDFTAGTSVSIAANEVTGDSLLQMALYSPGTSLGGINLLTGTNDEFRCSYVVGCSNNTIGQTANSFVIPEDGTYRLAITRSWGESCGSSGTYRLHLVADSLMSGITQTVDDVDSIATGWTCPD